MEPRSHGSHHRNQHNQPYHNYSNHHKPTIINSSAQQQHNVPKRNYKLLVDPLIIKGGSKLYRFEGVVDGDPTYPLVVVRDPRKLKIWIRPETLDLPVPRFKIDGNYVGPPPPLEVTMLNINDNIDRQFLFNEIATKYQCGPIEELHIFTHELSRKHLGIARIVFEDAEAARLCIKKMNNTTLMGKVLQVFFDPFGRECNERVEEIVEKLEDDARREEEAKEARRRPVPPPPPVKAHSPIVSKEEPSKPLPLAEDEIRDKHSNDSRLMNNRIPPLRQPSPGGAHPPPFFGSNHSPPYSSGGSAPFQSLSQQHDPFHGPQYDRFAPSLPHQHHINSSGPPINRHFPPHHLDHRKPFQPHPPAPHYQHYPPAYQEESMPRPSHVLHPEIPWHNHANSMSINRLPPVWPPSMPHHESHPSWKIGSEQLSSRRDWSHSRQESPRSAGESSLEAEEERRPLVSSPQEVERRQDEDEDDQEESKPSLDLETRIAMLLQNKESGAAPPFLSLADGSDDENMTSSKAEVKALAELPEEAGVVAEESGSESGDEGGSGDSLKESNGDDPYHSPLSTPPSPFISKEQYLIWHTRSLELLTEAHRLEKQENRERVKKIRERRSKRSSPDQKTTELNSEASNLAVTSAASTAAISTNVNGNDDCMSLSSLSSTEDPILHREMPIGHLHHPLPQSFEHGHDFKPGELFTGLAVGPGPPGSFPPQDPMYMWHQPPPDHMAPSFSDYFQYHPSYSMFPPDGSAPPNFNSGFHPSQTEHHSPYQWPSGYPQSFDINGHQCGHYHDPTVNAVLDTVIEELKRILARDLHRRMVEGTAFKTFESWWDEKERKFKTFLEKKERIVDKINSKNSRPEKIISTLFESKEGYGLDGIGSFGLGFRAAMPKMPSFRKFRKIKPPSPPRLEDDEDSQGGGASDDEDSKHSSLAPPPRQPLSSDNDEEDEENDEVETKASSKTSAKSIRKRPVWSSENSDDESEVEEDKDKDESSKEEEEEELSSSSSSFSSSVSSSSSSPESSDDENEQEQGEEEEILKMEEGDREMNRKYASTKNKEEILKKEKEKDLSVSSSVPKTTKLLSLMDKDLKTSKDSSADSDVLKSFRDLQSECEARSLAMLEERSRTPDATERAATPLPVLSSPSEHHWFTASEEEDHVPSSDVSNLKKTKKEAGTISGKSKGVSKVGSDRMSDTDTATEKGKESSDEIEIVDVSPSLKVSKDSTLTEPENEPRQKSPIFNEHSYCLPWTPKSSSKGRGVASVNPTPSNQRIDHDYSRAEEIRAKELQKSTSTAHPRRVLSSKVSEKENRLQLGSEPEILYDRKKGLNISKKPTTQPLKTIFKKRTQMEEYSSLYSFLIKGIDQEDIEFLKRSYESMLSDERQSFWLNDTHWVEHPVTLDVIPPKKRRRSHDDLPIHQSGCARAEGIYKVDLKQKQKHKFTFHHGMHRKDDSNQQSLAVLESSKAKLTQTSVSREVRSFQRRLLAAFGNETDSDLLKFNQLKFRKKLLKFGKSRIHDWGLFALEDIAADEMVIEYVGQSVRSIMADLREEAYETKGIGSSYLFRIDMDNIIDATKCGNLARFINHSCNPNCYAKIITVETQKKIVIYSKQPIQCGEEITYDYKFPIEEQKIVCLCGAPQCKGTLN